MKVARPPSPSVAYSDFLQCMLLANAQVQLQAQYHHRGEAASEKCLPAATFVRWRRRKTAYQLPTRGDAWQCSRVVAACIRASRRTARRLVSRFAAPVRGTFAPQPVRE